MHFAGGPRRLDCAELANARPYLGELHPGQELALERLTQRLVSRLLAAPTERIRSLPSGEEGKLQRRIALELFRPPARPSVTVRLRVGTRRSRLARAQTESILRRLGRLAPEMRFEAVSVDTSGDRDRSTGRSPDFTDTIDRALLRGEVDLAVHSAKDLPVELDRRFEFLACPRRADPRDCLVVDRGGRTQGLPRGARVGSSSLRRRDQLLRWRPDLLVVEIRGTSILGSVSSVRRRSTAAILAVAGISRLRRSAEIERILPPSRFSGPSSRCPRRRRPFGRRSLTKLSGKSTTQSPMHVSRRSDRSRRRWEGTVKFRWGLLRPIGERPSL